VTTSAYPGSQALDAKTADRGRADEFHAPRLSKPHELTHGARLVPGVAKTGLDVARRARLVASSGRAPRLQILDADYWGHARDRRPVPVEPGPLEAPAGQGHFRFRRFCDKYATWIGSHRTPGCPMGWMRPNTNGSGGSCASRSLASGGLDMK
jgi:hypothetical protein